MLPALLTILLFLSPCIVSSETSLCNVVISALNSASIAYEDYTSITNTLPNYAGNPNAQILVDLYANFNRDTVENGSASTPETACPEVSQYGVAAATHSLILEARRFVSILLIKKDIFNKDQQKAFAGSFKQIPGIVDVFLQGASVYAPHVLDILQTDLPPLLFSAAAAAEVLSN